jgi:hypothetical protein
LPAVKPPTQGELQKKPTRFARLVRPAVDVLVLSLRTVRSRAGEAINTYTLENIPADSGRGLLLHKHDGTSCAVCLSGPDSTCDCKGFTSHGHCKHVESLLAL